MSLKRCQKHFCLIALSISLSVALCHADEPDLANRSSCSIYQRLEKAFEPVSLTDLQVTPNGIDIYSDDLALQVSRFQPCHASFAFTTDPDVHREIDELDQLLGALSERRISDLPKSFFLKNIVPESYKTLAETHFTTELSRENIAGLYLVMASHSYLGEWVPKNDDKAIQYLKKTVDYYQSELPEYSPILNDAMASDLIQRSRKISQYNPVQLQLETEMGIDIAVAYLLSNAGHKDTQAMLLTATLKHWDTTNTDSSMEAYKAVFDPIVSQLIVLGNQGSHVAIHSLAEIYHNLSKSDAMYQTDASFWQHKADALPKADSNWQ